MLNNTSPGFLPNGTIDTNGIAAGTSIPPSNVRTIGDALNGSHVALDTGFAYWTDQAPIAPEVARVAKDGSMETIRVLGGQNASKPSGIGVDDADIWWTDFVAGTVVVHEKPTEEVRPSWSTSTETSSATPGLQQVTAEELVLIETYLSRRFDLDPEVRLRTAIQIADRIKAKTGLQSQPHQHVDDFLEESARKIRDSGRFH